MNLVDLIGKEFRVVDGEHLLTGEELWRVSGAFAQKLRKQGLGPGKIVAVRGERTCETVAAIVGILRSGAAYLPLNPDAPESYLARILEKANAVKVDFDASDEGEASLPAISAEMPAYILPTSGTTGEPKLVEISHGAAAAFVCWAKDFFALTKNDVIGAYSPFHFDLSIFDLFAGMSAGAKIVVLPRGIGTFPSSLVKRILEEQITVWYSVPQVILMMAKQETSIPTVRCLISAGDVLPASALDGIFSRFPSASLFNLYGPTETNVCTAFSVPRDFPRDKSIPIGTAVAGDRIELVDEEIVVTGPTLMSRYLGERKVEHFATGDFARALPDGKLELLGRRDQLVKVGGYRVSLLEVEREIEAHPAVEQAAVVAETHPLLGKALIAVVVGKTNDSEVTEFLRTRLPAHMVPLEIRFRDSLPLTANGKIDRQKLSAMSY